MTDSGARGSKDQIKQLAGMRGLMAKPQKSMKGKLAKLLSHQLPQILKKVYLFLNISFLLMVQEKQLIQLKNC